MPEYKSEELLFLNEPKVTVFPFPIDCPKYAGKFLIYGVAFSSQEEYPYSFYLHPTGTWRKQLIEDGHSAYYDTSLEAKKLLLRTRVFRDPSWESDADYIEIYERLKGK